jgi:hypothetical protein
MGGAPRAQTVAASQPFEVDEGVWEVTLSKKYAVEYQDLDPKTIAAMNEGLAKNVTVQHATLCLTHEFFRQDSLFGTEIMGACARSTSSSSQTLEIEVKCDGQLAQRFRFERIDSGTFKGSIEVIGRAERSTGTLSTSITAKRLRNSCYSAEEVKQQIQARGIAVGANPTVLSFLPYTIGGNDIRFGRYFDYSWDDPNPKIPALSYKGGIPGGPPGYDGVHSFPSYFHGTDGTFLYVTITTRFPLVGGLCDPNSRYKIDKSGTPTRISKIPPGLLGGKDQYAGPVCQE